MKKAISRRDFLKVVGVSAAALGMTACGRFFRFHLYFHRSFHCSFLHCLFCSSRCRRGRLRQ